MMNYSRPKISSFLFLIVLFKILLLPLHAQTFDKFIDGLQDDLLFTNTKMAHQLNQRVQVRNFGTLSRIINPEANAIYIPLRNMIQLDSELLQNHGTRRDTRLKDAQLIRGNHYHYYLLSTIFHEMGHAELDTIIEEENTIAQMGVMYAYRNLLRSYYRQTFGVLRPYMLFHEHFAYYRTDLIEKLYGELLEIYLENGVNIHAGRCFLSRQLRNKLEGGMTLDEFSQFFYFDHERHTFYRHQISPQYIFVSGRDYNLHEGENYREVLSQAELFFWAYHQEAYNFPFSREDFVARLNKSSRRDFLNQCRKELFINFHMGS